MNFTMMLIREIPTQEINLLTHGYCQMIATPDKETVLTVKVLEKI